MTTETVTRSVQANSSMNEWINSQLEELAAEKGWDSIPMEDPGFNFVTYVKAVMQKMGFRGLELDEKTNETIQRLLFDIDKGGPGPLLRQYDGIRPFDKYWKHAVQNRGLTEARDQGAARKRIPTTSIKPSGKDETSPGVSQEIIPGKSEGPDDEYMGQTFQGILRHLNLQRHGDILTLIFRLMAPGPQGEGMAQREVVDYLNTQEIMSPTGETSWSPGMVNSYIQKLRKAVRDYAVEEDRGEGGEGTLLPILKRKQKEKAPTPEGLVWYKDGNPDEAIPVEKIRGSHRNTRIRLPDGSETVVPSKDVISQ